MTTHNLDIKTLALIFRAGTVDRFGRCSTLVITGVSPAGYSTWIARNVSPHVHPVADIVNHYREAGYTHIEVGYEGF